MVWLTGVSLVSPEGWTSCSIFSRLRLRFLLRQAEMLLPFPWNQPLKSTFFPPSLDRLYLTEPLRVESENKANGSLVQSQERI